jgi:hypothetical protein
LATEIRTALEQSIANPVDIEALTKRLVRLNSECSRERSAIDAALAAFERGVDVAARTAHAMTAATALDRENAALVLRAELGAARRVAKDMYEQHRARLRVTIAKRIKAGE